MTCPRDVSASSAVSAYLGDATIAAVKRCRSSVDALDGGALTPLSPTGSQVGRLVAPHVEASPGS